jgi:hypothetical protein
MAVNIAAAPTSWLWRVPKARLPLFTGADRLLAVQDLPNARPGAMCRLSGIVENPWPAGVGCGRLYCYESGNLRWVWEFDYAH